MEFLRCLGVEIFPGRQFSFMTNLIRRIIVEFPKGLKPLPQLFEQFRLKPGIFHEGYLATEGKSLSRLRRSQQPRDFGISA
jgi:hypothetical protein